MPAAYLISESQVTDQALMDEYAEKAAPRSPPTMAC